MDNLIDLVRSLLSVNVVEDSVRSLGENRERVTRALFGVVPAVIARWAIDLQSALEEERLTDRLQLVRGIASNLQGQDWVAEIAHEILESDYPEETAQRIFGDAPIDDLFLEATAQYLRVPVRLIRVLAPLVDGICLVTIAIKLAPDASNRKELFDYIKGQQQFIPVNMMSMLSGQDVLTAPAGAISGRLTYPNHPARTEPLDVASAPSVADGERAEAPHQPSSSQEGDVDTGNLSSDSSSTASSLQPESVFNSSDLTSNTISSSASQPFAGGEIRWVMDDEPSGILPRLMASWRQQPVAGRAKVVGGMAVVVIVATALWSGVFGGGQQAEIVSQENQLQVAGQFVAEKHNGNHLGTSAADRSAASVAPELGEAIGEDDDTRAMLAAVKQAHADLEANPGKKVMSQPLVKNDSRRDLKGASKDIDTKNLKVMNQLAEEASTEPPHHEDSKAKSIAAKSTSGAAIKYNDAIKSEELTLIADRLTSKEAAAGVRNGSSFLLNGITFERSTSKLERAANQPLKALAKILIENPDLNLKIVGHSDNSGRPDKNQKLSLVRAWSVESELRNLGVVGARIRSEGKGAAEPLTSNTTEEGREQNRRIEFVLYRARE